jgi:tetratricopeptide (TPR) repeat protein
MNPQAVAPPALDKFVTVESRSLVYCIRPSAEERLTELVHLLSSDITMLRDNLIVGLANAENVGAIIEACHTHDPKAAIGVSSEHAWHCAADSCLEGPAVTSARAYARQADPGHIVWNLAANDTLKATNYVDHVTSIGRVWCSGLDRSYPLFTNHRNPTGTFRVVHDGPETPVTPWLDRPDVIRTIRDHLNTNRAALLTAPPGYGKTRTGQAITWSYRSEGNAVLWADLGLIRDATALEAHLRPIMSNARKTSYNNVSGGNGRSGNTLIVLDNAETALPYLDSIVGQGTQHNAHVLILSRRQSNQFTAIELPAISSVEARILARWLDGGGSGHTSETERHLIDAAAGQPAALHAPEPTTYRRGASSPAGYRRPVATSFTDLAPSVLETLLHASVFEGPFTEEAAVQVVDTSGYKRPAPTGEALATLHANGLVVKLKTTDHPSRFQIPPTVREAGLKTLGRSGRRAAVYARHTTWGIHRGRQLAESVRAGDAGALLTLSIEATDLRAIADRRAQSKTADALQALLSLIPLQVSQSPLPERVAFLQDALALTSSASFELRTETRKALAEALIAQGRLEEAKHALEAASEELEQRRHAQPKVRATIDALRVQLYRMAGDNEAAVTIANAALKETEAHQGARGIVETELGVFLHAEGNLQESLTTLNQAMRRLKGTDMAAYSRAAVATGDVLRALGKRDEASHRYSEAREHLVAIGDRVGTASVLGSLASLYLDCGRYEDASKALEQAFVLHRETHDDRGHALSLGGKARLHHIQGDLEAARSAYQEAVRVLDETGDRRFAHLFRANEATVLHEMGDASEAARIYEESIDAFVSMGDRRFAALFLGRSASLAADEGRVADAMQAMERAEKHLDELSDPLIEASLRLHRAHVAVVSSSAEPSAVRKAQEILADMTREGGAATISADARIISKIIASKLAASAGGYQDIHSTKIA